MEKVKKIYLPIFDYTIHVIITDNIVESRNKRKLDIGHELHSANVAALHSYNDNKSDSYLFFYPKASVELISHEVYHAIDRLFIYIEAEIEREIFAYHLGYLTQQVYNFINAKK